MSATSKKQETENTAPKTDSTVEVLYQKLGDKWYAFSIIDDEVFFGSVPENTQDPVLQK
jgi:hypothetical protein